MYLRNEFAAVEVELDQTANGPRLKVMDVESGVSVYLDPLQLQALTLIPATAWDSLVVVQYTEEPDESEGQA
jgi:hypothetical protein